MVPYSDAWNLNSGPDFVNQMVIWIPKYHGTGHLNSEPFHESINPHDLNTQLVCHSDPYCHYNFQMTLPANFRPTSTTCRATATCFGHVTNFLNWNDSSRRTASPQTRRAICRTKNLASITSLIRRKKSILWPSSSWLRILRTSIIWFAIFSWKSVNVMIQTR